jgi:hypothetical protein
VDPFLDRGRRRAPVRVGERALHPGHRHHGREPEHVAEDGPFLEEVALVGVERRDARLDRALHRDRERRELSLLDEQPRQLLEEEAVAPGHRDRVVDVIRGNPLAPGEEVLEQRARVGLVEVLHLDPGVFARPRAPFGAAHVELGARAPHHDDRGRAELLAELLDELERVVVGGAEVVEHQHDRRRGRVDLEEVAQHRARDLVVLARVVLEGAQERRVRVAEAEEVAEEVHHFADAPVSEHLLHGLAEVIAGALRIVVLGQAEAIAEQARDRGPALVRRRAAAVDAHRGIDPREPFRDQARLPGPLVSGDGHELRRVRRDCAREQTIQRRELAIASDQRADHAVHGELFCGGCRAIHG